MASMSAKQLTCTGVAAVFAFSALLSIDSDFRHQSVFSAALAGNGNGHSGGNGGGNGKGGGEGNGNGNGAGGKAASNPGATASALGRLNASHASATALANASPNSAVGKIAANEQTLAAYEADLKTDPSCLNPTCQQDLGTVDSDLKAAANKPITTAVVTALDANLGLTVDPAVEAAIAAGASQ
jgi:hypothetical protein